MDDFDDHGGETGRPDVFPGDDLIFLAMMDEEEREQRQPSGQVPAGGCCALALAAFGLGVLAVLLAPLV